MSASTHCKRCGADLAGKLGCATCITEISDESFLNYQRQFAPTIFANQCEITLVYVPAGHNGQRTRLWHLKRLGDPQHAYCGCKLDPNYKSDKTRYFDYQTTAYRCELCADVLDRLIREAVAAHQTPIEVLPIVENDVIEACFDLRHP